LTFREAQLKLLAQVQDRIRNGEFTERGFARQIGISQPHANNVLKGVRNLSPNVFDAILKYLHMSILDLALVEDLEAHLDQRSAQEMAQVAFFDSPVGPGRPWPASISWRKSFPLPFPSQIVPITFAMANLEVDPLMHAILAQYDIALLDTSERLRSEISPEGLYVVSRGAEAVLRYIRPGARGFYLVTDSTLDNPNRWEQFRVPPGGLAEIVKARVRWLGRVRDRDLPGHQRGRFLYAPTSS
jgi:transcriptional regulator with XRE-family HTH domain